ncbi:MAG: histidine phosphatase family protein [Thermodesulfovibrionales bacterium]|nr:histidine phosphatase family protein [Thermodesulfovibrionales bacterium]
MVTTLYLVRHGDTEGSEEKRYKGSIDVPMSEEGIEQVRRTVAFISAEVRKSGSAEVIEENNSLKNFRTSGLPDFRASALTAVYCSPLSRALKSAEIIAEPFGLKPVVMSDLRERNFGIWEGMSFTEIKEQHPKEFEAWATNPLKYSPIKGESTLEVRDRVVRALNMILENHKNNSPQPPLKLRGGSHENIAIVAHGGVNRIMLCHILGIPLKNIFRVEQDTGAVNIIEFWDKYPVVKLLNYGVNNGELT